MLLTPSRKLNLIWAIKASEAVLLKPKSKLELLKKLGLIMFLIGSFYTNSID